MYFLISLFAVLAGILWWFLYDEGSPLDKLPGPPRKPIVGCVFEFLKIKPDELFLMLRRNAQIFGDRYVVKILKRRILHIHSADDVEIVLSHSKNIKKSKPYTFLQPWLGTGLLLSFGSKWHRRRKILTPTFHFNILKGFTMVMEERTRALVEKLKKLEGNDVSLIPVISDLTLYVICETAMGTQLESDKSAATLEYKDAIADIGSLLLARLTRVWLHNDYLFRKHEVGKKFEKCLQTVRSFADNVIRERKITWSPGEKYFSEDFGTKKRLAMLDLLLEAEHKGEIDLEGIREEVNTFMFEGHDTTAMAIVFALMLLADHEDCQERIFEECQSMVGGSDRSLTMSDLSEMKYLEAVIKEALRLYPSVPFIAREITEDFMLGHHREETRSLRIQTDSKTCDISSPHLVSVGIMPCLSSQDIRRLITNRAREKYGVTKCWTREGCIYVLDSDGHRHKITSLGDLAQIKTPDPVNPPAKTVAPKTRRAAASTKK